MIFLRFQRSFAFTLCGFINIHRSKYPNYMNSNECFSIIEGKSNIVNWKKSSRTYNFHKWLVSNCNILLSLPIQQNSPFSAALNSQPKWQSCQECELCRAFVIFPQFESLKLPAKSSRTYTSFNYVQLELDTHRLGYNAIHNVNRTKVGNLFKYRIWQKRLYSSSYFLDLEIICQT